MADPEVTRNVMRYSIVVYAVDLEEPEKELQKVDPSTSVEFPNDGSFLERMKQQLHGCSSSSADHANGGSSASAPEAAGASAETTETNGSAETEVEQSSTKRARTAE
eukprot:gb/GECG01005714.1/.p1 GENE.gb/GECG01005714.1/~~gb/GECG01005714.1/.p1  ORF type:complete len:107 (+),score=23.39 gb/GECG01005714.1/:1-321(+)